MTPTKERKKTMLKNFRKNEKGFTLIELLIVVAIIGILAAIAIPQFSAYRIRGYNSAATADIRNGRTTMEAFFSDWQVYPSTVAAGVPGSGARYISTSGVINIAALTISATAPSAATTVQYPVSANVGFVANTSANGGSYTLITKNSAGDRCFAADADATQIYWVSGTIGTPIAAAGYAIAPTAANDVDTVAGVAPCTGTQANWTAIN